MDISRKLQEWYDIHKRDLPWRETDSPYFIWLSEIIMQQTRIVQGLGYYLRFTEKYPRVEDLAVASQDEVLKLWQGLGYYTRARNLHATAKFIAFELNGVFPGTYRELLNLKGIGKYTAAAIASFAFREPVAVVDGNVFRVISRLFGIDMPIDTEAARRAFAEQAELILDKGNPDIHNQAIMELGAMVCLPKNPQCNDCPLSQDCLALKSDKVSLLPVRSGKRLPRDRYFNYLFIVNKGDTWLNKRVGKDIWNSLYEFPLIETTHRITIENLTEMKDWKDILGKAKTEPVGEVKHYKHQLTHQTIHCSFFHLNTIEEPSFAYMPVLRTSTGDLGLYAIPKLIEKYLEDLNLDKTM